MTEMKHCVDCKKHKDSPHSDPLGCLECMAGLSAVEWLHQKPGWEAME